jgi:uncharacterized repeat protein (TIGR01451 family)
MIDADDLGETITNIATADSDQTGPADDSSDVVVPTPSLTINKSYSVEDSGGGPDSDQIVDTAGDTIKYQVVVTNTGTANLTSVEVTDQFESADLVTLNNNNSDPSKNTFSGDNGNGILDVGETWTYSYSHEVSEQDLLDAREIVVETIDFGLITCEIQACTGDLDLDNYVEVTTDQTTPESDFVSVGVTCPEGFTDSGTGGQGDSIAEHLFYASQESSIA